MNITYLFFGRRVFGACPVLMWWEMTHELIDPSHHGRVYWIGATQRQGLKGGSLPNPDHEFQDIDSDFVIGCEALLFRADFHMLFVAHPPSLTREKNMKSKWSFPKQWVHTMYGKRGVVVSGVLRAVLRARVSTEQARAELRLCRQCAIDHQSWDFGSFYLVFVHFLKNFTWQAQETGWFWRVETWKCV